MKIKLYKLNNRYSFSIDKLSSLHHWKCIPQINPSYEKAWEALSSARELCRKKSFHIHAMANKRYAIEDFQKPIGNDTPAEEALINHYKSLLADMAKQTMGTNDNPEDEREKLYLIMKSQVEDLLRMKDELNEEKYEVEIKKLIDEYRKIAQSRFSDFLIKDKKEKDTVNEMDVPLPPASPEMSNESPQMNVMGKRMLNLRTSSHNDSNCLSCEEKNELMEHYGNCACEAISKHHMDAICKVSPKKSLIKILGTDNNEELLIIYVNSQFNVSNIVPCKGLSGFLPSYSCKFYQRYWKPIVEAIGHFSMDDIEVLVLPELGNLPDMPLDDNSFKIKGWRPRELKSVPLSLSFKSKVPIWLIDKGSENIKEASSPNKYSEEIFIRSQPTRVECIDPKLDLYGKIGEVVNVIPLPQNNGFDVDVNFGRKIVRLSQNQIKMIDEVFI